jgi:hypothetical protein
VSRLRVVLWAEFERSRIWSYVQRSTGRVRCKPLELMEKEDW